MCVIAYCSRALRPSQRKYYTTKREMLEAVSMCIQFRSYLRSTKFTLCTDHKSLVWLHHFKDTVGMMARWLHTPQQFQFTIVHRAGSDHDNADGLSRAPTDPCRQCTRADCPQVDTSVVVADQPFDAVSVGDSQSGEVFSVTALQMEDPRVSHCWSGSGLILSPPGRR